jgi:hypothetical protein
MQFAYLKHIVDFDFLRRTRGIGRGDRRVSTALIGSKGRLIWNLVGR